MPFVVFILAVVLALTWLHVRELRNSLRIARKDRDAYRAQRNKLAQTVAKLQ